MSKNSKILTLKIFFVCFEACFRKKYFLFIEILLTNSKNNEKMGYLMLLQSLGVVMLGASDNAIQRYYAYGEKIWVFLPLISVFDGFSWI